MYWVAESKAPNSLGRICGALAGEIAIMNIIKPENLGMSSERLNRIAPFLQHYVDDKKLAGFVCLVARGGQTVYFETIGLADINAGRPMQPNTIFRIFSMSKPVTSTAIMMLVEEGRFHINTPVSDFAPWFKDCKILVNRAGKMVPEPLKTEINIHHLLTHTSGLSYGFEDNHLIDSIYRDRIGRLKETNPNYPFDEIIRILATIPLVFEPGTAWRYSMATDVLGYVVQQASGKPFETFLRERIFEPLGMVDTGFYVPTEKINRFAVNYAPVPGGGLKIVDDSATGNFATNGSYFFEPSSPSGGAGLVSTAPDYLRFCQMLLNLGELEGERLLGRKTVEWMTINHLPNNGHIDDPSLGFGLGFAVLLDPALYSRMGSKGLYCWGGAANTKFWIDPQEQLIGILMLQCMPDGVFPVEQDFQNLVYQAIK
jgi:CubicO group peptidase (beta-lactamase class C family)